MPQLFRVRIKMLKTFVKCITPKRLIPFLIKVKNNYLGSHVLKSYSQEGEDMILRRIFENKKNGFYLDVGAHHPKRFSNTYFFYKKGWRGINIDAMPGSMDTFNRVRPRDINIEQPISDEQQTLTYYAFNEPALNGFSKKLSDSYVEMKNYSIIFTKELETKRLDSVLDTYLPNDIHEIDFLTIDVEGLDFQVLKSINLAKYQPKVILVEILGGTMSELFNDEITIYLEKHKYGMYAKSVNTVIFRHITF
jgi:FkbM family methyltransferase